MCYLCIPGQFFSQTVGSEVCDVLWTFVGWLRQQHTLESMDRGIATNVTAFKTCNIVKIR